MDNNSDIDLINNSLINLNITKKNSYEIINRFILKYIYKYKIKKSEPFNINIINIYLDDIININYSIDNINQNLSLKKIRKINFPSEISENIVKYCMFKKYNIMPQWDINYPGDLSFTILNKRLKIEVKAFSSSGPISFGPNEFWDWIYFVDATDYKFKNFIIYELKISSVNINWLNIYVNKNETIKNQNENKRRPRITFNMLKKQLDKNNI